ncbi:hypothetical protein VC279_05715 [Xanthomonas sp. WHRI 10064A]|uniref:hypothetical protein n=1 Tax=unclassified Xanthomonas TaxID=2643310 RepID=UPI002B2241CD|nr:MULTISPECIES: hypothetical protein [unclassified Xanthomonas]MEA9585815.1 hypothetical protein [Xanthomonas sp. WHRI 10064B]MEA9614242.1 hypothetical protein [Xanthomonas sp. WHRI 10064A]
MLKNLEIAAPTALPSAAKTMRDAQAQSVCWQTLPQDQDQAIADWLLALLPALIEECLVRDAISHVTATQWPPALMP